MGQYSIIRGGSVVKTVSNHHMRLFGESYFQNDQHFHLDRSAQGCALVHRRYDRTNSSGDSTSSTLLVS